MENDGVNIFVIVFQLILKAVIFGILPFLVFMMITSRTPMILGIRSFVVLTGSMNPILPPGSIVFTQNFPNYKIGDIIAFKSGNVNVTHRIIDFEEQNGSFSYKTHGDANNAPDSQLVSNSQILGKVFYSLPYLGKLTIFLKTLPGFLLLIVSPALVFVIFEIINIKNELTKEIEKKVMRKMQTI